MHHKSKHRRQKALDDGVVGMALKISTLRWSQRVVAEIFSESKLRLLN